MHADHSSTTCSTRDAVRFDPDAAVVATVATHESTKVFVVCLEPHQALPSHRAPGELTLLVIDGHLTISVSEASYAMQEGAVLLISSGALHSLVAGSARAVVVGVLNEHRDDPAELSPSASLAAIEAAVRDQQ